MSQNPFSKGSEGQDLPPPFTKAKENQKKDSRPVYPIVPFEVGRDDHEPSFDRPSSHGTGGMFIGPDDPVFQDAHPTQPSNNPSFLPQGAVPPGARFDPINPMSPARDSHGEILYPSGEPDPDELLPPGPRGPRLGWRPPKNPDRLPQSGPSARDPFGGSMRGPPFFR